MNKVKELIRNSKEVIKNFPFVLLSSFVATISFIAFNELDSIPHQDFCIRLAYVALLGNSLFFGLTVFGARYGKPLLSNSLGVLILVYYFYFLIPAGPPSDWTSLHSINFFVSAILFHLFSAFAPFIGKHDSATFWQYNKNLFLRLLRTKIFSGVLVFGIMLSILSIDQLFLTELDKRFYMYPSIVLSIIGSSFIFLLFSRKGLPQLLEKTSYPNFLKFFSQYILIPLLLIYVIILDIYGIKILLLQELPKGFVSLPIMAYCVIGILAILLTYPLQNKEKKNWISYFSKWFYILALPLLALLFTGIITRILDYGFTENRYFILVLGLWMTFISFYYIFLRNASIRMIPMSLFLVGLISLAAPYYNVFSTTNRSQFNQLNELLKNNDLLLENNTIAFDRPVKNDVVNRINETFHFLKNRSEKSKLEKYFNNQEKADKIFKEQNYLRNEFTNVINNSNHVSTKYTYCDIYSPTKVLNISEWEYIFPDILRSHEDEKEMIIERDTFLYTRKHDYKLVQQIKLKEAGEEEWLSLNISELLDNLKDTLNATYGNLNKKQTHHEELFIQGSLGSYTIKVVFFRLNLSSYSTPNEVSISNYESSILLLKKTKLNNTNTNQNELK